MHGRAVGEATTTRWPATTPTAAARAQHGGGGALPARLPEPGAAGCLAGRGQAVVRHRTAAPPAPPPSELSTDEAKLAAWRAGHVFGSLHHRRGPAFVTVLDRREKGTAVRLTLDHPDLLAAFLRLQDPAPLDAVVGRPGGRRSPPSRAAGAGRRRPGGGAAPARPAPAGSVHHGLTGPSRQGDENRRSRKRSTRA
ncbi:DUF5825 family protein [Streptomyces sp. NPDC003233]